MCNIESNLRPYLTDSEKKMGWEIHDKIKSSTNAESHQI